METGPSLAIQEAKRAIKDYHHADNDQLSYLEIARRNFAFAVDNSSDSMTSLKALIGLSHTHCYMANIEFSPCTNHAQCAVAAAERALCLCQKQFQNSLALEAEIQDALGCALRCRFVCLHDEDDCDRAVAAQRTSLEQTAPEASASVWSLRKYHLAYALYTSLRRSDECISAAFMPNLFEALSVNPTGHQSSVHHPNFRILAGGLSFLLARVMLNCAYMGSKKTSQYLLTKRPGRFPRTNIGAYELKTRSGPINLNGVIVSTAELYHSILSLDGCHHRLVALVGGFSAFLLEFSATDRTADVLTEFGGLVLPNLRGNLFRFDLRHTGLLMDILHLLVQACKMRHGLEIPGLIEEVGRQLHQILPQTHMERPQLHFLLGQSLLIDQGRLIESGSRNINYSLAIDQFRQTLRLTRDWHPSQDVYLTHFIAALSGPISASGSGAHQVERKEISQELEQWLGVSHVLKSAYFPGEVNRLPDNLVFECLKALGTSSKPADTAEHILGVFEQMIHPHTPSELSSSSTGRSQHELESSAQLNLGMVELAVFYRLLGPLPRRFANEAVLQWQQIHASATDSLMIQSDIEFGLGFALACQGMLMQLEVCDLQEAYRLLSSGLNHMERAISNKEPTVVADIQNLKKLADTYAARSICDVRLKRYPGDLSTSMDMFQYTAAAALSLSLPPWVLYDIFSCWAHRATTLAHESALEAYSGQINALVQLSWVEVGLQARYNRLQTTNRSLSADAATSACAHENMALAVEFLESGRTILFTQMLPLRNRYTELRKSEPALVVELERVGKLIEQRSFQPKRALASYHNQLHPTMDEKYQESYQLRCLGQEWDNLVTRVRGIKGYENFLQTPPLEELCQAAARGPIIFIITSDQHNVCYAVAIKSPSVDAIRSLKLPLSPSRAKELAEQFQINISDPAQRTWADCNEEGRGFKKARPESPQAAVYRILTDLWHLVMKPIIDLIGGSNNVKVCHCE